jgi:prepilin-type N-terminal cleavage/methylation domain-containing protein
MKRRGFTLIELLVVIAIIAILAAILFPVFASARHSAQMSKCLNNLKQCSLAVNGYMNDNCSKFPMASWAGDGSWLSPAGLYCTSDGRVVCTGRGRAVCTTHGRPMWTTRGRVNCTTLLT